MFPKIVAVCVGTDRGPDARPLRFAEKDALDVARVFDGKVGPYATVSCLLAPSRAELRHVLHHVASQQPDHFVFYNSGHGSLSGFLVGDGEIRFDELATWLHRVGARHSITFLDTCRSGSFLRKHGALGEVVGGVDLGYLQLLTAATPSSRVICSVGADRTAREGDGGENGNMTVALIEALSRAPGVLRGWVSDHELFTWLERISIERFRQQPLALGLTGDLPLFRAQRPVIGAAGFAMTDVVGTTCNASAVVLNRYGVPTALHGELVNRSGRVLAVAERRFVPVDDNALETATFAAPPNALALDPYVQMSVLFRRGVQLAWRIDIRDLRGRVFDVANVPVVLQPAFRVA